MNFRGIYKELKRRNVIKVATVYGITAWLIAQIVSLAANTFGAPPWVMKMVIILLLVGFPLALIFAWAFELTPEGLKKTEDVSKVESKTTETSKKLNGWIIGVFVLLVTVIIVENIWLANGNSSSGTPANVSQASIAVLPFRNMSSDEDNRYFSEGLSEELLNDLAQVDSLKVAGRASSFKFKGQDQDIKKVRQELGVGHILEGSVRKAGNRVRITVQLINAQSGDYMWSQTYDRKLDDIFAIQEDISKSVLSELKVRLLPHAQKNLETIPTSDVEAYQTYLKANQLIATRNIDDINQAIVLYKDAIKLDPGFAQAHARLAIAYNLQGYYGDVPMQQVQQHTRDQADRALFLNSELPEAYAAIGLYYINEGEGKKAQDALLKSLELNPNQPNVHGWLGTVYGLMVINYQKMEGQFKKAYELDPLDPYSLANYAVAKRYEGNFGQAEALLRENMRVNPDYLQSYSILAEMKAYTPFGQLDSAFVYARKAFVRDSTSTKSILLMTLVAIYLDMNVQADHYYELMKARFPNSADYIWAASFYAIYNKDYAMMEQVVLPYIRQYGLPQTLMYPALANYALATRRYEQVMAQFQKGAPDLFKDHIPPITQNNYEFAGMLIPLLRAQGNTKRAQQLTAAYCSGIKKMKGDFLGGEQGGEYAINKGNCLLYQGKYEQALPYVRDYFLNKNGIYLAPQLFDKPAYKKALQRPAYRALRKQVSARLAKQRESVISYLKKERAWKPKWDE